MATETIADELTCPVCLEFYNDPRLLPCHHSLCKSCLVALRSKKENNSDCELQCPSCRHLFQAKNETYIESLPKNFTLASIVCKFEESMKGDEVFPCDVCEEGQNGRAIKKCLQCQLHYCRMCLEQLHPKRGALANHKLVHVLDAYGKKHEHEKLRSAFLSSVSENQFFAIHKHDQQRQARYCMSCDEICTKGDQISAEGNHEHHDTTEMQTAFRKKKEEFECTLARLLDEDQDLEKELAVITGLIETIRTKVEEKKIELIQRFGELADEVESRKISAENRIEEESKTKITSLESRLSELNDLKMKTTIKIAAFSELSSLTNEEASIFLIKLKKLQNEIGPVGDYIKQANISAGCDSSLPIEWIMNEIIANAIGDICPSERRLQIPDPNLPDTSSKQAIMAIKVTNIEKEGTMSADVEWVAIHQEDHYEVSYFCDPEETVMRRNIVENRCRLTNLRWDSVYTITVTAYLPDGKTSFDSTAFKTDPKVKDPNLPDTAIFSKSAIMAIKVTNVQKEGAMSADVEWMAIRQVDHYKISYFCDTEETMLRQNIVENRCRLINLRWDSKYTITVTAYLPDGKTSFDSTVFRTNPKVEDPKPASMDIRRVHMAIKVTNVQKAGTMSADVEWSAKYPAGLHEVSYFCDSDETVMLKTIGSNTCRLTNLLWDSTYTVKVTTQLQNGQILFDVHSFETDPHVTCYPMAVSAICNKQFTVPNSLNEFTASNRNRNWTDFNKIENFSGIVFTPVLREEKHFWTMNIELSIFQEGRNADSFLDFGILNYSDLGQCFGLNNNTAAYSCLISRSRKGNFHLKFKTPSCVETRSYQLHMNLYQKAHFCYGFMYDQDNFQFAVMDCLNQKVLHVFNDVTFNDDPIFAVCPYHSEVKMRVKIQLDHMHCTMEDVSCWMRKIDEF